MSIPDDLLRRATEPVMRKGLSVLQAYRFGDDEVAHCRALLAFLSPAKGAQVLDVGCGIGGVARHMRHMRPDLSWILLNASPWQLEQCADFEHRVCADMLHSGLPDACVDVVMVGYTFGYADCEALLREFCRLLVPRGVLFIVDLHGHSSEFTSTFQYHTYTVDEMCLALSRRFDSIRIETPKDYSLAQLATSMEDLPPDQFVSSLKLFGALKPVMYTACKPVC